MSETELARKWKILTTFMKAFNSYQDCFLENHPELKGKHGQTLLSTIAYKVFVNTIIHKEFRTLYLIRSNSNPPNPTLIYANLALPLSLSCTLMAKLNSE